MTEAEKIYFESVVRENLMTDRSAGYNIGTYKEKRLHNIIKYFLEPNDAFHEIKIGKFTADILRDKEIIEVQKGSFYPMREKVKYYLKQTDLNVSVVRPLPYIKWCVWIDKESGEIASRKKSPKKYVPQSVMRDWIFLSDFLNNPRLKIRFLLLEAEEYRFLDGWSSDKKRGSNRYEIIPLRIIDEEIYGCAEEYLRFLPSDIENGFTAAEYNKKIGVTPLVGNATLKLLCNIGILRREKQGRAYIYFRI